MLRTVIACPTLTFHLYFPQFLETLSSTQHFEQNEFSKNECPQEHFEETKENSKRWISIDSATATSMGTNKEMFHSIEIAKDPAGTISNGGELDLDCTAEMNNVGRMPFSEDGIANSFGMNDSCERGFRVHMDTDFENCIFVEKDGIMRKFMPSNGGLHFHDLWNNDLCFERSESEFQNENDIFDHQIYYTSLCVYLHIDTLCS